MCIHTYIHKHIHVYILKFFVYDLDIYKRPLLYQILLYKLYELLRHIT